MNRESKAISLDALLFVIIVVATMQMVPDDLMFWKRNFQGEGWLTLFYPASPGLMVFGDPMRPLYNVVKVVLIIGYIAADIVLRSNEKMERTIRVVKLIIVGTAVLITVIAPAVNRMAARHYTGPSNYAHDGGVVQTEEAVRFLIRGENPYSVSYRNTPVKDAVDQRLWDKYGIEENPITEHFPYPPFAFLSAVPFLTMSEVIFGWYDQRFIYLALFILTLVAAWRIPENLSDKLSLVILLSLNPFAVPGIKDGMNDVMLLFLIVLLVHLLKSERMISAAVCLALACGSKQMAWVMVPFFFVYILGKEGRLKEIFSSREIWIFTAIIAITFLPFLAWDGHSFLGDILSFHAGRTDNPYPLRGDAGYGFANLVLHFGWVNSVTDYFPFTIFGIFFTLPVMGWSLYRQLKDNRPETMMTGYGFTLFVFLFFGRYMAENYIGLILSVLAISYFTQTRREA